MRKSQMLKVTGDEGLASSGVATRATPFRTGLVVWCAALLLGWLVLRGAAAVNADIDIDEFHFLHSAWMVGKGYLPYRDFWTNHSPLFIYLLKPLVALYNENLSIFLAARALNLVVFAGLLGLVAAIAARQWSTDAGLFAALLMSTNLVTYMATVRLRHDPLTVTFELLALVLLARGIGFGRSRDVVAAGALLGIALALSPKGLFGLSGLVIGCLIHHLLSSPSTGLRRAVTRSGRDLALLMAGCLGTFGLVVGTLVPREVWPLMIKSVFLESLLSPERFSPLTVYLAREVLTEPVVWLVMAGAFGVAARKWWVQPMRRDPTDTLLLVAGLWFGVTYLFLMSSPYRQSALPFTAIGSVFGGRLLATGAARLSGVPSKERAAVWATGLAVLVGWMAIGSALSILEEHTPFRRMNAHQMEMIQYVLSLTGPEDAVFDDNAAYVFRPQASYYGSLMSTVRLRIQRGELEFDLPERCQGRSCKVVIMGSRLARLPQKVQMWIRDNYTPSLFHPQVLLHNSLVSGAGRRGASPMAAVGG